MSNPIVSLCIPTNGVVEWVFPVLDSIYEQGCDNHDFEVVITDNGNNKNFKEKIKVFNQQHSNLHYFETNALPFINEIESYIQLNREKPHMNIFTKHNSFYEANIILFPKLGKDLPRNQHFKPMFLMLINLSTTKSSTANL